jgi:hypothetical protein
MFVCTTHVYEHVFDIGIWISLKYIFFLVWHILFLLFSLNKFVLSNHVNVAPAEKKNLPKIFFFQIFMVTRISILSVSFHFILSKFHIF